MRLLSLVLLLLIGAVPAVQGQPADEQLAGTSPVRGVAVVHGWPDRSPQADTTWWADVDFMPFLEGLTLTYRLDKEPEGPRWTYKLAWEPSPEGGLRDGKRVAASKLPKRMRLDLVELVAEVVVAGDSVGRVYIEAYDLNLPPYPEELTWEATPSWDALVDGLTAADAQVAAADGFTLRRIDVRRIGFAVGRRSAQPVTAYDAPWYRGAPRGDVWIIGGRAPRLPVADPTPRRDTVTRTTGGRTDTDRARGRTGEQATGDREVQDRGAQDRGAPDRGVRSQDTSETGVQDERVRGRTTTDEAPRTRSRSGKGTSRGSDRGNDSDDDDDTLLPAALMGAAAVGMVAVGGGTVGYMGHLRNAPVGVASGYVTLKGGVILNVAANEALLARAGDRPEHLVARFIGFADVGAAALQPSLGLGVMATQFDGETTMDPSVSLGAAINFKGGLLLVGYDVAQRSLDLGVAVNFRTR